MRAFGDPASTRKWIYRGVFDAAQTMSPVSNSKHTLSLTDLHWGDSGDYTPQDEKQAILEGRSLSRRLRGTWNLTDNATGKSLDSQKMTIARVPHLTSQGTFIHNGNAYTVANQQRLRAGSFVRVKENGEIEAHANILPGKGPSHRYHLDPEKGVFYLNLQQAKIPLLPLLRAMGAADQTLRDVWGSDILAANYPSDSPAALAKLYHKLVRRADPDAAPTTQQQQLLNVFQKMELDPAVTQRTLGKPYARMGLDTILSITKKLLDVSKGKADVDDRDHLAYQTVHGPEDLFAERLTRDYGGIRRKLLFKASFQGGLKGVPPGALDKQLEAVLLRSGLGEPLEEINPAEVFDKQFRISRMGEGGIPGTDSIPDEARAVQPSHFGFLDPVRTPESLKVGVDIQVASGVRKGNDGKIYAPFLNPKTGKTVYRSPQDVADLAIAFPGEMERPGKSAGVIHKGRMGFIPKDQVDLVQPHFEHAFSPLSNLIPLKAATKPHRVSMGSRMLAQSLPLQNPEAPLVQSAIPGHPDRSFEEEYGRHMGALYADGPQGTVLVANSDQIVVAGPDGKEKAYPLYNHYPHNRKTFLHQTPIVQRGQQVKTGDLLAISNYTDRKGTTALGKNARVAYLPFRGLNTEDAVVISEGFAKKLSSEHMYQEGFDWDDEHVRGKSPYISMFPGKYHKEQLANLTDDGIVRQGAILQPHDPIILALREKPAAPGRIYRRGKPTFADETVTWEHEVPGVVTDVVQGKRGPAVLIKSIFPTQVGDKLCYDPETRLLTQARGWVAITDVTRNDELATMNPVTEQLEWQRPTHLHAYDYAGLMYKLVTKHLDMLVTPNHYLWVARPGEPYGEMTAEAFYASKGEWQFRKDVKWSGHEQAYMTFEHLRDYSSRVQVLSKVCMDDWLEFLGFYIAEGWCDARRGYIKIGQYRTSRHWRSVRDVLKRLGLTSRYNEADGRFEIGNVWLRDQLVGLGDSYSKRIPDYVQALSQRQISIFLDAYLAGDGHKGGSWKYSSSSEKLVYDVQLLCFKLGWAAAIHEVSRKDNWSRERHWRARVNRRYLRPWWKKGRARRYASNSEALVPYTGKVYCVTVPNHILLVERRAKSYLSLNSGRYG